MQLASFSTTMIVFRYLYLLWVAIVFSVFMFLFLPFVIIPALLSRKGGKVSYFFIWLWAWVFSHLCWIRYKVKNRDKLEKGKSYIFVSNHTSYLDSPALPLAIRGQFRPLGKKELGKIPVFGLILKSIAILVDRSSTESRKKSLEVLKSYLDSGISIFIFPEGTMIRDVSQGLLPFYDGAFRLAIDTQTDIMPMVIHGAVDLMPRSRFLPKPGTIEVEFLDEIKISSLQGKTAAEVKEHVRQIMLDRVLK